MTPADGIRDKRPLTQEAIWAQEALNMPGDRALEYADIDPWLSDAIALGSKVYLRVTGDEHAWSALVSQAIRPKWWSALARAELTFWVGRGLREEVGHAG